MKEGASVFMQNNKIAFFFVERQKMLCNVTSTDYKSIKCSVGFPIVVVFLIYQKMMTLEEPPSLWTQAYVSNIYLIYLFFLQNS